MQAPRCPSCTDSELHDLGEIPAASEFASTALPSALPGGHLFRCGTCALRFRWPQQSAAFYDALYARAEAGVWESHDRRIDHELIASAIQRLGNPDDDVLDIGCGSGALLSRLPPGHGRFGVEIGVEACEAARRADIEIVVDSFLKLATVQRRFRIVTAIDVIEHHPDPARFVDEALALLKPGGLLMLSTGNAEAPLWRLTSSRFWYCHFAEHLSFISPSWLDWKASASSLRVEIQLFPITELAASRWLKLWALLALYLTWPSRYSRLLAKRRAWRGAHVYNANPPGAGLTRDHMLVILQRA